MLAAYRGSAGPERFLLAVLGATTFFDGYDRGILELALPQIRDTYGLSQSSASLWLAALYVDALPALFLGRRADQIGRRRLSARIGGRLHDRDGSDGTWRRPSAPIASCVSSWRVCS